jgi:hypothetical protein
VYHDNLAKAREEGRTGGHNHRAPVATKDVRAMAARLVEDEEYQENLQKRLRTGEAGAMEIWLWRWAYGDPKRSTEAESERDRQTFAQIRKELKAIIHTPHLHAELEERVLSQTALPGSLPQRVPQHRERPIDIEPDEINLLPGPVDE